MRLYSLGGINWDLTQLLYHAMGYSGLEGVVICRSRSPYFCVGFHQAIEQELDTTYLDSIGVPYFRRETGGGTVRLDDEQVFYQVVMHKDNPEAPFRPDYFCAKYLGPVVEALDALGLKGQMVPPNDILVQDRKISGNGGGQLGDCKVLVGDLLVDYDAEAMCKGLSVPSESFREACVSSMRENIITVKEARPGTTVEEVEMALIDAFSGICDDGTVSQLPKEVHERAKGLGDKMHSKKWLLHHGPKRPGRRVKIREGTQLAALALDGNGWLQVEVADGGLKRAWLVPTDMKHMETLQKILQERIGDEGGPLQMDLKRTFQDMGFSSEWSDGLLNDVVKGVQDESE